MGGGKEFCLKIEDRILSLNGMILSGGLMNNNTKQCRSGHCPR